MCSYCTYTRMDNVALSSCPLASKIAKDPTLPNPYQVGGKMVYLLKIRNEKEDICKDNTYVYVPYVCKQIKICVPIWQNQYYIEQSACLQLHTKVHRPRLTTLHNHFLSLSFSIIELMEVKFISLIIFPSGSSS